MTPPRERFADIPADYELPAAGSILVGDTGSMPPHVDLPKLFPEEKFPIKAIPVIAGVDHFTQWADACLGNGQTTSHFDYAGPLTEAVPLGTIGIRFPEQELAWDAGHSRSATIRRLTNGLAKFTGKVGSPPGYDTHAARGYNLEANAANTETRQRFSWFRKFTGLQADDLPIELAL